jgi:hypothetical protein
LNGSVIIDFDDGDTETVAAKDVVLPLFDQKSNVPLDIAYKAQMDPTRRRRTLAKKLHESLRALSGIDLDDSEHEPDSDDGPNTAAHADCESDDSSDEEGALESSTTAYSVNDMVRLDVDTIDLERSISGATVRSMTERRNGAELPAFQRVAAAHMLVLAGEGIRIESPEVALAVMLNPISGFSAGRSDEEGERIMELATTALTREIASELEANEERSSSSISFLAMSAQDGDGLRSSSHDELDVFTSTRVLAVPTGSCNQHRASQEPTDRAALSRRITAEFWANYTTYISTLCKSRDPLDFWSAFVRSQSPHPAAVRVLRRYLSIPPSAAACERMFSIMTASRNGRPSLLPSTLRQLVFLNANRNILRPEERTDVTSLLQSVRNDNVAAKQVVQPE